MLKLLSFLALIQLAVSTGPCSKGPSYWCESVQTAKECSAFKHCIQSVWSKQVAYIQKDVLSESNECHECTQCLYNDIRQCPYLRGFRNEIAELFENNLPSESICKLLKKCGAKPIAGQQKQSKSLPRCNSGNKCANLDMASKCSSIDECMNQWISSPKKYQLKKATGVELTRQTEQELNSERACGFCIFVMTKYQSVVAQNKTETELLDYLESACKLLPSQDLQKQCYSEVNSYLPQIFNFLRDNADPGVVCHVIQMCKDSQLEEIPEQKFDWSKVNIKVVNSKSAIIRTPLQQTKSMLETNGMACEMCNLVVEAARYLVKNDIDNKAVLQFVEKNLCVRLGEYSSSCVDYLQTEGEKILGFLEDEVEPSVICAQIGLCMNTQKNLAHPLDLQVKRPSDCKQCEGTMEHVKELVSTGVRDSDVLAFIKKDFCEKNGDMKYLCTSTLDAHKDILMVIFKQDIKPHQLCRLFRVCGDQTADESAAVAPIRKDNQNCILCQFVMKQLDQFLYKEATEEEIQQALDKVCTVFPNAYKTQCKQLVDTYTKTIIFLIVKKIPAEYVCETIGVCDQPKQIEEFLKHSLHSNQVLTGAEETKVNQVSTGEKAHSQCILCEFSVNLLQKYVLKNTTQEEAKSALKKLCNKEMPANLRTECSQFVDVYGEQVIELIINDLDPEAVCKQVGLCEKTKEVKRKLLGSERLYEKLPKVGLTKTSVQWVSMKPAKLVHSVGEDLKIFEERKDKETMSCTLCIYVAQLTDNFLKKNKTQDEIEEELKLVCNYFPTKLNAQCQSFVDEYGPYVVQLIADDLEPEAVCEELNLCGNDPKKTALDYSN